MTKDKADTRNAVKEMCSGVAHRTLEGWEEPACTSTHCLAVPLASELSDRRVLQLDVDPRLDPRVVGSSCSGSSC